MIDPLNVVVVEALRINPAATPELEIVPVVNVLGPEVVSVNPLKSTVPEYPLMVLPLTDGAISREQFPFRPPAPLKTATFPAVGTDAPPAPPETADQFEVLFQFEAAADIQNLFCPKEYTQTKRKETIKEYFFIGLD